MPRRAPAATTPDRDRSQAVPAATPEPSASPHSRGAWLVLLALVAARAMLAFLPSMWPWGINLQRFLDPPAAWGLWAIAALLLWRPIAERAHRLLERISGPAIGARTGAWAFALLAAGLVGFLPDRTWITGDFILRQSSAESGSFPGNFAQSLPLEVLLNQIVPSWFGATAGFDPNLGSRLLGALYAGTLASLSLALVRAWTFSGVAACVGASIICFGGYLTSFSGLGKPAALMCVLTVAATLGATRLVRQGSGGLLLGGALGVALLTHRVSLALVPLWAFALWMALRAARPRDDRAVANLAIAGLVPVACGGIAAPMMWRIVQTFDVPRHLMSDAVRAGGLFASAFAPLHVADLANLALAYVPVLPLLLAPGVLPMRGAARDGALLATLIVSFAPMLLFVHPIQGVFRDLEVFAPAGIACALLTAHAVGAAFQHRRLPSWLAPSVLALTIGASAQWLLHFHDATQGLRRARAYAVETPARPESELAQMWDVIAYRGFRLRAWEAAAEASAQSVRYAPHPRARLMLAIARSYARDDAGAHAVYLELTRDLPEDPLGWLGLAGTSKSLGDSASLARALSVLNGFSRGGPEAARIRAHLKVFPELWPAGAKDLGLGATLDD